jgi:hypothetical protein
MKQPSWVISPLAITINLSDNPSCYNAMPLWYKETSALHNLSIHKNIFHTETGHEDRHYLLLTVKLPATGFQAGGRTEKTIRR